MNHPVGMDQCLSFINAQLQAPREGFYAEPGRRRAVTISRQTGSGGHSVAANLAERLNHLCPSEACRWTVFDKNLVEKVLEEHHMPGRLARFMPEDRIGEMADTMDELFGLHPPSWTLVRQTAETILHLAELGNVILIGRGATLITRRLPYVFHVRLVGSLEHRVHNVQESEGLSAKAALDLVNRQDLGRQRYLKKYFNRDIDDPLLYHMVINTDWVRYDEAARIIAEAVRPQEQLAIP